MISGVFAAAFKQIASDLLSQCKQSSQCHQFYCKINCTLRQVGKYKLIFYRSFPDAIGKISFFSFKGHPVIVGGKENYYCDVVWRSIYLCVVVERPKKPVGFAFCLLLLVRPWAPGDFLVGIIKSYVHV
jgi:hypothetical protein